MSGPKSEILLIGSVPPPYHGSNVYFENLLNSRVREEFAVVHLDTSDHRSLDNIERVDLVNVWLGVKNVVTLLWLLLTRRFALVYVPIAPSFPAFLRDGLFLILSAALSHAPIVVHLHRQGFRGEFYDTLGRVGRWFVRWALRRVKRAIVLGERLKQAFDGLLPQDAVVAVPNGIVDPVGGVIERVAAKEEVVFGYLGNLFRTKGIMELLQAFARVSRKYPEVRLEVAGGWWKKDADLKLEVERFLTAERLKGKVRFWGIVRGKEKDVFLRTLDVLVFPSYDEGFPLVLLEAMCYSLPVISSRGVGAIPEIVVDKETGMLVNPRNIAELEAAMVWMVEHPQQRERMGRAARRRFEEEYTLERNVERMIRVFHHVIAAHK